MGLSEKTDNKVTPREAFIDDTLIDDFKSILKNVVAEQTGSDNSNQSLLRRGIPEYPFIVLHQIQQEKELTVNEKRSYLLGFAFKDIAYLFLSKRLEVEEAEKDIILISPQKTADLIKSYRDRECESRGYYYYTYYTPSILKVDNTNKDNPNIIAMYVVKTSSFEKQWRNAIIKTTLMQENLPEIFGETDLFYVAPQERVVNLLDFLDEEKITAVPIKIKALGKFADKMLRNS